MTEKLRPLVRSLRPVVFHTLGTTAGGFVVASAIDADAWYHGSSLYAAYAYIPALVQAPRLVGRVCPAKRLGVRRLARPRRRRLVVTRDAHALQFLRAVVCWALPGLWR